MNWLANTIEPWPVAKLLPYARNARTHSDEQIAKIAASILEFGFVNPILAGADGLIVAGHGRLLAARKLGLNEVPVVVLDHLSDTQRRALVLADNRLAELSTWDEDLLRIELDALEEADFDIDLTGFDADFLETLFAEEPDNEGETDPDASPEPPAEPITQPGDVWHLGEHRLVCGDATDALAYQRLFPDERRADMVFTDPPYNVNYAAAGSVGAKTSGQVRPILNDALGSEFEGFLLDALTLLLAATRGALHRQSLQRVGYPAKRLPPRRWALVDLRHLGQEHLHPRACRLPAPIRADPLRLAQGQHAPLVRGSQPRRCLADRQATQERSAPDHEAGGAGRARDPQFIQARRQGARCLRWLGYHPDRCGQERAGGQIAGA
ncbi:ParB N-terminal domain-containing protein [Lamprobacter modestohalophilus]|nr:ParB N-terminal domain-containing protein [Lamprobacter modestohalophilus]MEA1053364.1 ParB N-terminal domain-containing protein [Lamprobacter modestohalophilus]